MPCVPFMCLWVRLVYVPLGMTGFAFLVQRKILTLVYDVWNVAERPICAGCGRKLCFRRFALLSDVFATSDVITLWYLTGSGDLLIICGMICTDEMRFKVFEIFGISFSSLTT